MEHLAEIKLTYGLSRLLRIVCTSLLESMNRFQDLLLKLLAGVSLSGLAIRLEILRPTWIRLKASHSARGSLQLVLIIVLRTKGVRSATIWVGYLIMYMIKLTFKLCYLILYFFLFDDICDTI